MSNYQIKPGCRVKHHSGSMPEMRVESVKEVDPGRFKARCEFHFGGETHFTYVDFFELKVVWPGPEPELEDLSDIPMPSEAMRVVFMQLAMKFAKRTGDFFEHYEYLIRRAQLTTKAGSNLFIPDSAEKK